MFTEVKKGDFVQSPSETQNLPLLVTDVDDDFICTFYDEKNHVIALARSCADHYLEEKLSEFVQQTAGLLQVRVVGGTAARLKNFILLLQKIEAGHDYFDLVSINHQDLPDRFIADPKTGLLLGQ